MKVIFFLTFISTSFALVGVGTYVPFVGKMQRDKEGTTNKFSIEPTFMVHYPVYKIWQQLLIPKFGMTFHTNTTSNYSKKTFFLVANVQWKPLPMVAVNYGIGTYYTRVSGDGQAVTLNNGNSTSTFYQPSVSAVSYNTVYHVGGEVYFKKNYSINLDLQVFQIFSNSNRAFSYLLAANYYL